ncbi:MAG TPA: autotransporter-associated beta strand repeat-containing protein [Kiritimatiellia bacterium]|nr:autotransporter-associated beta strand repeat-containing protein [Kiritimatiellia bacterium]HPS08715.1 autotransporter-associated beta strand repeat-containing protein [Kiritimatiellia bacterium]
MFLNAHPVAGTLLCAVFALTVPAANVYWSGAGDGTSWSDPANWQGGAVPSGTSDIAYFSVRNNGILLDYSGTFTIRQLYFYVPTTLTIPAGCTLYLSNSGGAVLDATADVTIGGAGDLSLSTAGGVNYADVRPAAGVTLTLAARVTGVGGVENNNAGTIILANPQNTYPGLTYITVDNGVIEFPTLANAGVPCAIGTGNGFLATTSRTLFRFTGSAAASTDRSFAINNSPVGFEQAGTAPVTLTGTVTNQTSGTRSFRLVNDTEQPAVFAGLLSNGAGTLNLLKEGSGVWTLTTPNTYSGFTQISGGTLEVDAAGTLGAGPLLITGGSTLALNPSASVNFALTLPAVAVSGSGRITIPAAAAGSSTLTLSGLAVSNGFLVVDAPNAGTSANRILVASGLPAGPVGWIRLNGGGAQYDATEGLKPYAPAPSAHIAARGGVIPTAPGENVVIDTPGTTGPVTLAAPLTEIGGLSQEEPDTAASVDLAGGALSANQLALSAAGATLTLTNGMLTAAGVSSAVTNIAGLNTVTTAPLTDDASSGISSAKTYTHALDFGDQPVATVNGVAFTQVTAASGTLSGTSYGWSGLPTSKHNNFGDWTNTVPASATGLRALLKDMLYDSRATTVKLTGLVPGAVYELRLYTRSWDGLASTTERTVLYSFHPSADAAPAARFAFDKNHNLPTVIIFRYIAATTELTIVSSSLSVTTNPWSGFYGLTHELLAAADLPDGAATLVLENNNSASAFTVAAAVADNGLPTSLLRTGIGPLTLSGAVNLTGSTTLDGALTLTPPDGVVQTFGPVHGTGGLVKSGGGSVRLQSANLYAGPTLVQAGSLYVSDSAALGSVADGTTVAPGAALALADASVNTLTIKEPVTFAGTGPDGLGALRNDSDAQQQNAFQRLALSGDAMIGGTAATPLIPFEIGKGSFNLRNGTLDLAGHTLTKAGPCAFLLSYSRLTDVTGGAIDVAGGALGLEYSADLGGTSANTLTVRTGANIDLNRVYVPQSWALALEDGAHFSARSSSSLAENVWEGPVSLMGGQALLGGAGSGSISGPVSGPGGLVKSRGTTYLLNPENTYAGTTTVTNGVLYAAAAGSLPDTTPAKLNVRQNGALVVRYADDTATWPLAWAAEDVDAIATTAIFTQNSAALGFDPYYADATYDGDLSGFGLSKYGTRTQTLTGAVNAPGHIRVYDGELVLAGGTYDLIGTSYLFPGYTGSTASLGTLSITGDTQVIGTDTGYQQPASAVSPGHVANSRGILNIRDNAFLQGRLYVAENASGAGAIYQTGGTFNNIGGAGRDGRLGQSGYGYYRLDGGTVTNKGYTQLGSATSAIGILHQTGGSFIFNNGTTPATGVVGTYYGGTLATRGGAGLFHITGGTLDTGNTPLQLAEWDGNGGYVNGYSVLTLEGDALVKTAYVNMADRNSSPISVVNLNGGTLQTQYLRKGMRDNPAAAVAAINFNGGTLRAAASVPLAVTAGVTLPDLTVFGGGAVLDTAGFDPSITNAINAPTGYGVTGIRVTYPGSGYIAPPLVKITGGGGRGATAVAEIDRAAGTLTAIRMTSPGIGYTGVPTVELLGGGYRNIASNGLVTIGADLSAGGLTKRGAGSLSLSGTNTWRGLTTVKEGTLIAAIPAALPAASALLINGGTLSLAGQTLTNVQATITAGGISSGRLVTTALRKEGPGEALLTSDLQLTPAAAPPAAALPGLWEGVFFKNWDTLSPNPKTSVVLTTRAGNGPAASNGAYANGSWVGNNHTWIYSGYLWNRAATNVTWTWRGTFDDNVMLKIDQTLVLNTGNGGATATYTHKPGPHAIEIRFGDGTGGVGPNATITSLGGLTYDAGDGLGLRLLADPGDGSLLTADLRQAAPLPPSAPLPPEVAANVGALAAEYSLVYASDVPVSGGTINGSSGGSPYDIDNSAANSNAFDRVAYYLELVTAGVTNWVWVSFDALALDRSLIGYPTAAKKIVMQRRLANMDVRSNVAGINAVTASQAGNIEFWPNNYGQSDALGIGASSATNNTGYDFGDSMSDAPAAVAGHGSMQLHNAGDGTTLLALSNFGSGNNTLGIGIGNRNVSGSAPDWTFASNGSSYSRRRLYIFTRDVAPGTQPPPAPAVATVAEGTLRLDMPFAGLYEGMVRSAWTATTPNPRTSVQLTTRAGNIPLGNNTTSGNPAITDFWANNNHTWIYTGYLWNRTAADVTWTFAASFDDHAWLMINGQEIVHNINSGWTRKSVTLSPGPHAIEIRYSDGSGNVGPAQSGLPGGLCYSTVVDSTNPADYRVLTDPGDGSLLTTRADESAGGVFADVVWDIAAGATLDLGGQPFALDTLRGAGTLANGVLSGGNTVLSPGGDGALGVMTLAGIAFDGAVTYRADVGPGETSDRVVSSGALDVTGLRVTVNNPSELQINAQYLLLQAEGALTGTPDASVLPDKWRLVKQGNALFMLHPSGTILLLH